MITCDECGRENDDEYKYCLGCGAALHEDEDDEAEEEEETKIINCPYCGTEQPSDFKFCGSCGEKIPDAPPSDDSESESEPEPTDESVATSPGKPGSEGSPAGEAGGPGAPASETSSPDRQRRESEPRTSEQDRRPEVAGQDADTRSETPRGGEPAQAAAGQETSDPGVDAAGQLVVIRPDGTEGASIDVPEDKLTVGRDSDVEALSSDPFLSPQHASFLYQGGSFTVRDENSLNGIFREVVDRVELQHGDLIRVGQELLEFERYPEDPHADDEEPLAAGSPDPGFWGRLRLVAGPEVYTESYALGEAKVTIGRETGDIVFSDDGFVSGTHARIGREDGTPILEDLNSSNGTFIRIRDDYRLGDGERVLMGQQLFRLEITD